MLFEIVAIKQTPFELGILLIIEKSINQRQKIIKFFNFLIYEILWFISQKFLKASSWTQYLNWAYIRHSEEPLFRSSLQEVFFKRCVLKIRKIHRKTLVPVSLFLMKLQAETFNNTFFIEHLRWLFLPFSITFGFLKF